MDATKKWADKLRAKGKTVDFKQLLRLGAGQRDHEHQKRFKRPLDAVARPYNRGADARGRKAVSALGTRIDRKSRQ